MGSKTSKAGWFEKISTTEQAQNELRSVSQILMFLSVLGIVAGWFTDTLVMNIIPSVFYLVVAVLLKTTKSRIVAIILFIGVAFFTAAALWMLKDSFFKGSWVLVFLSIWVSRRAVEATFILNERINLSNE